MYPEVRNVVVPSVCVIKQGDISEKMCVKFSDVNNDEEGDTLPRVTGRMKSRRVFLYEKFSKRKKYVKTDCVKGMKF